jgi:arginine utilization protein RocB
LHEAFQDAKSRLEETRASAEALDRLNEDYEHSLNQLRVEMETVAEETTDNFEERKTDATERYETGRGRRSQPSGPPVLPAVVLDYDEILESLKSRAEDLQIEEDDKKRKLSDNTDDDDANEAKRREVDLTAQLSNLEHLFYLFIIYEILRNIVI